jgi:uncharacterized DUF497 family protein
VQFEWDEAKAQANLRKHGIRFEVAAEVFFDPFAILEQDRIEHGEYRWRTIGMVNGHMLLVVANVPREEEGMEIIRIISARRADRQEKQRYEWENR